MFECFFFVAGAVNGSPVVIVLMSETILILKKMKSDQDQLQM
jgi:hypothetical protein